MPSSTRLLLTLGTLVLGLGCGSGDSSVLLTLSGVPARATQLAVTATLDQKPLTDTATSAMALALPLKQNQLGITVPAPGHLALNIVAYDSDQCTQGSASPEVDVVAGLTNLSVPITAVSPRKCGRLTPCAAGAACPIASSGTSSTIRSLFTIAPNDIWAVGTSATVLHYDGTSWTATPPSSLPVVSTTRLNGVWASASNDVWAVGAAGQVIHFDGTKWTTSPIGALRELKSISGVSGQNIWTVGLSSGGTTLGEFWQWNGTGWMQITPFAKGDLNAVLAVNPNFIVVAGGDSSANGVLWTYDGASFKDYSLQAPVILNALWASSTSNALAVGAFGKVLSFDGTAWTLNQSTATSYLNGVTSDGHFTYLVGASGYVARTSDPTFTTLTPIKGLTGSTLWTIQLASNGLAWLAGDNGTLSYLDTRP